MSEGRQPKVTPEPAPRGAGLHEGAETKPRATTYRDPPSYAAGILEAIPLPLWLYEATNLRIIAVSDAAVERYGYVRDEFVTLVAGQLYADEEMPRYLAQVRGEREGRSYEDRWRHRTRGGRFFQTTVRSAPVEIGGRSLVVAIALDPVNSGAEHPRANSQAKLEAVGRLAGGVAHDFNNLLTAIGGYAQLLTQGLARGTALHEHALQISRAASHASSLTYQLLAFSRRQVLHPTYVNLNSVVVDMEKILRRIIGEDIELVSSLEPDLGSVRADPGQIEQVIMNLAVNARDAMPLGGRLTITTANVSRSEYAAHDCNARTGTCVALTVSDTGAGMDVETQSRIFEPFFTTKAAAGTGLGLATVYGIVKQSGGHITVRSSPGQGATFIVCFPRLDDAPSVAEERQFAGQENGGSETILLVEDERAVRGLVRIILDQSGYKVLEADGGEEAIRLCESYPGSIDLLLTDVVMPGMSGRKVAESVSVARPGIKVIYMSGYTDDAVVRHGVLEDEVDFVQKPFTPDVLVDKLRQVLDRQPES